jgi:DNA-binding NtrC family response regulator
MRTLLSSPFAVSTQENSPAPVQLIYVVDDAPDLPDLCATLLEAAGYLVRAFGDRSAALAAMKVDRKKPDLLITDYRGPVTPVEWFLQQCLAAHPALRILMASGYSQPDRQLAAVKPDRFLQKPFTCDELRQEVQAAMAPSGNGHNLPVDSVK